MIAVKFISYGLILLFYSSIVWSVAIEVSNRGKR